MDSLNYASSLGAHVAMIPKLHPDREDALISLAAGELLGETAIWSNDKHFQSVYSRIPVYDHIQFLNLIKFNRLTKASQPTGEQDSNLT